MKGSPFGFLFYSYIYKLTDMYLSPLSPYQAVARPHLAKEKEGLCEPMPFVGMPKLVVVGQVMTKTPEHCPLRFKDRVLGFFEDERYYSETYTKLPYSRLIKVKKNLDPWQQVSIALSYLPALQILQSCPFTVDNNRILLNGGMGPINHALIRLCKLHGAKKIHVPVEPEYDSLVREIGAKPMGPLHSDWGPILIDTIDIVVDCIGENKFITSKAMLVETGHMIVTGCKDLDSRKGQMFNGLDKRYVDWRLNSSTRITIFDFMKAYVNDREVFEKDFKYLDKMVFDEQLPVLNTRIDMNQMNMANGDRRETEALDGYQIMQIPNADGWKR